MLKSQFIDWSSKLNKGLHEQQRIDSELFPYNGYIKDLYVNNLVMSDILSKANQPKKLSFKDLLSFIDKKPKPSDLMIYSNGTVQLMIKKQHKDSLSKAYSLSLAYMLFFIIPFSVRLVYIHRFISKRAATPFPDLGLGAKLAIQHTLTLTYFSSIFMQMVMIVCEVLNFSYKLSLVHIDPYKIISLIVYAVDFGILFQILVLTSRYITRDSGGNDGVKIRVPRLVEEVEIGVYEIAQIIFMTVRFLQMLIHIKQLRMVINMIRNVLVDILWYLVIWAILLLLFTFIFIILGVQTCLAEDCTDAHDDYAMVDELSQIFIQMARNSVGDLAAPVYSDLYNIHEDILKPNSQTNMTPKQKDAYADYLQWRGGMSIGMIKTFVYAIWLFWALNCFINTIIFMNLLIAEVNNTYQKIMSESTEIDFSVMAELNFVYAKYWRSYDWSRFFYRAVTGTRPAK